jgi:hypothetical protein
MDILRCESEILKTGMNQFGRQCQDLRRHRGEAEMGSEVSVTCPSSLYRPHHLLWLTVDFAMAAKGWFSSATEYWTGWPEELPEGKTKLISILRWRNQLSEDGCRCEVFDLLLSQGLNKTRVKYSRECSIQLHRK